MMVQSSTRWPMAVYLHQDSQTLSAVILAHPDRFAFPVSIFSMIVHIVLSITVRWVYIPQCALSPPTTSSRCYSGCRAASAGNTTTTTTSVLHVYRRPAASGRRDCHVVATTTTTISTSGQSYNQRRGGRTTVACETTRATLCVFVSAAA